MKRIRPRYVQVLHLASLHQLDHKINAVLVILVDVINPNAISLRGRSRSTDTLLPISDPIIAGATLLCRNRETGFHIARRDHSKERHGRIRDNFPQGDCHLQGDDMSGKEGQGICCEKQSTNGEIHDWFPGHKQCRASTFSPKPRDQEMFMGRTSLVHASSCALLVLLFSAICSPAQAQMKVSSFDGAVTASELQSFNDFMTSQTPAANNIGNKWAQGVSGEQTKAMGLVFLMAGQKPTLDQMIRYCDAVLSERNDLAPAPTGQHVIWTGRIDPVWPNNVSSSPIQTGGEQGDPVGHLSSCAYLILKTTSLYSKKVAIGDPHGYGATYLDRAKKYLAEADHAMSNHILNSLLDLSRKNQMYFAANAPYQGGHAVPWNQQMMFNYALQNLCSAHRILGDNSTLLGQYKKIIVASLQWFFTGGGSQTKTSAKGNPIYDWGYSMPSITREDSNHGSLDVAGFYRAYISNDYGITAAQMKPFANMFVDVMTLGPKNYAGRVEGNSSTGHAASTTYVRSGYLFLADFRPDAYQSMISADLQPGGTTKSTDSFSRFLWVKNQRNKSKLEDLGWDRR